MASNYNNLGAKVVTRTISWTDMVQRAWGSEYNAPDKGAYEFSGGRQFESTDTGQTGLYNPNALTGIEVEQVCRQYPDMPAYLLTESGLQLDQG